MRVFRKLHKLWCIYWPARVLRSQTVLWWPLERLLYFVTGFALFIDAVGVVLTLGFVTPNIAQFLTVHVKMRLTSYKLKWLKNNELCRVTRCKI